MKIENYYTLFSLIGLLCDIIGAFFLSIEAIGIEKIINWKNKYFEIPSRILTSKNLIDIDPDNHIKFPIILIKLFIGFSMFIGIAIGQYIWDIFSSNKGSFFGIAIGFVLVFPIIFIAPRILSILLKKLVKATNWTENNYRNGQAGIFGFTFLVLGFFLQFIGNLIQFGINLPK